MKISLTVETRCPKRGITTALRCVLLHHVFLQQTYDQPTIEMNERFTEMSSYVKENVITPALS